MKAKCRWRCRCRADLASRFGLPGSWRNLLRIARSWCFAGAAALALAAPAEAGDITTSTIVCGGAPTTVSGTLDATTAGAFVPVQFSANDKLIFSLTSPSSPAKAKIIWDTVISGGGSSSTWTYVPLSNYDTDITSFPASLTATAVAGSGWTHRFKISRGDGTINFTVSCARPASVSISQTQHGAEGGNDVRFTLTQSATSPQATTVPYTLSGSASATDYSDALAGTATIAAGQTSAIISLVVVDDAQVEGTEQVTATIGTPVNSTGVVTKGTPDAATANITDNDIGSLTIANVMGATEGGPDGSFTVVLNKQPSATVTVSIGADGTGQCTRSPPSLSFTTANWNQAQPVTVTAVDDAVVEGSHSCTMGAISASGGSYDEVTGTPPTIAITDNDTGSITIVNVAGATEGGPDGSFTVVLDKQPLATVTVSIGADGTGQCTRSPPSLSFTTANWNQAQPVTVTAVDDAVVEGSHSCTMGAISASGGSYDGVTGTPPTIAITDNDTASFTVAKDVDSSSLSAPGLLNYTITVENTGTVLLTSPVLSDSIAQDGPLTGTQSASLSLDKTTTSSGFTAVGDPLAYSYLITNSGNVTLAGPFTVADDKTTVELPGDGLAGACRLAHLLGQLRDRARTTSMPGSVTNTATATNGPVTSASDSVTVTGSQQPSLSLDKTTTSSRVHGGGRYVVVQLLRSEHRQRGADRCRSSRTR